MQIRRRKVFLRDLLTALFRQRRLEAIVFLVIVGGTYAGNWLMPSVYESTATLLVTSNLPNGGGNGAVARDDAILLLQDMDFQRSAIDQIGLGRLLQQERSGLRDRLVAVGRGLGQALQLIPSLEPVDRGSYHLQRHLTAAPGSSDRLIRLSFTATDPGFAQTTLGEISRAFVELHQRPAGGVEAGASTADRLAAAERALQQFVATHDPDALATQYTAAQQRADDLRAQLRAERDTTRLGELADLEAEASRARALLDELQRLEEDVLALSASAALSGDAAEAPELEAGPVIFSVVTPPTLPVLPISPHRLRNVLHALWIGIVLAPLAGLIAQSLDHSILFPEDLEHRMSVPVLGSAFADATPQERAMALQQVCARLRHPPDNLPSQVWLVTSAHEGTGSMPADIARTLAEDPTASVLFLDLQQRDGQVGADGGGFGDVVLDRIGIEEVVRHVGDAPNLWGITRGAVDTPNPLFLAAPASARHWQTLRERYTDIIVSAPPILDSSDTLTVASRCDAVLLVVQAERVRREVVARACEILADAQAHVGGAVLINRRTHIPGQIYTRI